MRTSPGLVIALVSAGCVFEALGTGNASTEETSGGSSTSSGTTTAGSSSASGSTTLADGSTSTTTGLDESSTGEQPCARAWTTVDDFRLDPAQGADARGLVAAPDGTMVVAGYAVGPDFLQHWMVRRGTDLGTWETLDDWQPIAGRNAFASMPTMLAGREMLVVGSAQGEGNLLAFQWRARRSDDGGSTWSDADVYQFGSGLDAGAERVVSDGATVWASGYAERNNGTNEWHVRRSAADGALGTWTDNDAFQLSASEHSLAYGAAVTASGDAFVAGYGFWAAVPHWVVRSSLAGGPWTTSEDIYGGAARDVAVASDGSIYAAGSAGVWAVRRTMDLGETWETVDLFQLEIGKSSEARALLVGPDGLVAAFGLASDALDRVHAIVRSSEDAGESWQSSDDYLYMDERSVIPRGFAQDATGDVYLSMMATDIDELGRWIVRRASCR